MIVQSNPKNRVYLLAKWVFKNLFSALIHIDPTLSRAFFDSIKLFQFLISRHDDRFDDVVQSQHFKSLSVFFFTSFLISVYLRLSLSLSPSLSVSSRCPLYIHTSLYLSLSLPHSISLLPSLSVSVIWSLFIPLSLFVSPYSLSISFTLFVCLSPSHSLSPSLSL